MADDLYKCENCKQCGEGTEEDWGWCWLYMCKVKKDLSLFRLSVNGKGFRSGSLYFVSTYALQAEVSAIAIAELQARGWVVFNRTQLPGRGEFVTLKKEWKT